MQNTKENTQEQQALNSLNNLLSEINARDLRVNLNELFYGFLASEKANSQSYRTQLTTTHSGLIEFLTKLTNLPEIDRFDR